MADLKFLAAQMRSWAESYREQGDAYDDEGNTFQASWHWGQAKGYREAADMVDREIEREARDV